MKKFEFIFKTTAILTCKKCMNFGKYQKLGHQSKEPLLNKFTGEPRYVEKI